ncbi:D-glycero-beta-D-manno-heptose 1-phosphate adenylyltransferase [Candidatus Babeliales bacterium]|nr:D-glycero-beta-D-manno-heptose 1-phosphate adenylyltransferase [Candidatus Babeliales bacterium]
MKNLINKVKLSGEKKVLVIGDVMLDEYLFGDVSRISPEAPVPVLKEKKREWSLGGAANVALNCKKIGMKVELIGVVGKNDYASKKLLSMLSENGVSTSGIVQSFRRVTTCKKRAMANSQQLLRIDTEDIFPLVEEEFLDIEKKISDFLQPGVVVLISDYAKGVLTTTVLKKIIDCANKNDCLVIVDPKGKDFEKYKNVNYLKPNYKEFCQILDFYRLPLNDSIIKNGKKICELLCLNGLIITLGEKGIQFVSKTDDIFVPACKREVFDLTGAGDTVISFLALGLSIKLPINDCLKLANYAASVVISHLKTYAVGLDEIFEYMAGFDEKIFYNWFFLKNKLDYFKKKQKKIVFTNGCFDLLHSGHLHVLNEAKKKGDILIVGINTDDSVKRFKGNSRPIKSFQERAKILAAMEVVDFIVSFDQDTPAELIEYLMPDVLVKGADYQKEKVAGYDFMIKSGGKIHLVDLQKGLSTSALVFAAKKATC